MYLPEYGSRCSPEYGNRGRSPHYQRKTPSPISRSMENICSDMQEPEPVWQGSRTEQRPNKKKKFTFQSTVRLIENKKIAEKLSREAEFKGKESLF